MLYVIILLVFFTERIRSFYLPTEYRIKRQERIRRAEIYLQNYGYFETAPICPINSSSVCARYNPQTNKITEEEALKRFQKSTGIEESGIVDVATNEMMEGSRCGNSDAQKLFKRDVLPWNEKQIFYTFLNYTNQLKEPEIRNIFRTAFTMWEVIIPRIFVEIKDSDKADIKILFGRRDHGDKTPFDGPGGEFAHAYKDGRLHFDDDEIWKIYSYDEKPIPEEKDLYSIAVHEIGHVLGLLHSQTSNSIMTPIYSLLIKRNNNGFYSNPEPIRNDVENVKNIYGGKLSKASKNGLLLSEKCSEFCFV